MVLLVSLSTKIILSKRKLLILILMINLQVETLRLDSQWWWEQQPFTAQKTRLRCSIKWDCVGSSPSFFPLKCPSLDAISRKNTTLSKKRMICCNESMEKWRGPCWPLSHRHVICNSKMQKVMKIYPIHFQLFNNFFALS